MYILFSCIWNSHNQPNSMSRQLDCLFNIVTTHVLHLWFSLKITNRSFRYAAPCPWNELPTSLHEPRQIRITSYHRWQFIISTITIFIFVRSFILNLRLRFLVIFFRHRTKLFPHLPDWFHGLSDHCTFFFCSTAGFVCMVHVLG